MLHDELSVLRATALGRPIDLRVEKKYYKACIYMVSGVFFTVDDGVMCHHYPLELPISHPQAEECPVQMKK